jgi:hypothetical protein
VTGAPGDEQAEALGRFPIIADASRVAQFRAALALPLPQQPTPENDVPLTFPICWLAQAAIKDAISRRLPTREGDHLVLVHTEQSFHYRAELRIGGSYWLTLDHVGPEADDRFRLEASVRDEGNGVICRMSGRFLLMAGGQQS